jgi:hypothetical protein
MKINVKKVLANHIAEIKIVDSNQSIPKLAKTIDSITQQTLRELYNLKETCTSTLKSKKKGHCC